MKKFFLFFATIALVVSMAACSGDEQETDNRNPDIDNPDNPGSVSGNYIVVYYSWSGNSKSLAEDLAKLVDGKLVEIVPAVPYPDYSATAQRYKEELAAIEDADIHPEIETTIESFENYDAVFLCYPLWGSRMSTPTQGFLHKHREKLSGKTLALICSTASSGIEQTVADVRRICPDARLTEALRVYSSQTGQARSLLSDWLERIGIADENQQEE